MLYPILLGGLGGIVPTVAKLAASYVADPRQDLPQTGMYFGLLLLFAVGATLVGAMKERDLKQAFILGICAPAVITNIVSGANEARARPGDAHIPAVTAPAENVRSISDLVFPSAHAQAPSAPASAAPALQSLRFHIQVTPQASVAPNLQVYGIADDGATVPLLTTPASSGTLEISVPVNMRMIGIASGGHSAHVILPGNAVPVDITAQVGLVRSSDFLWALGADRTPRVSFVESRIAVRK